jgi:hypothetical protein
MVVTRLDVTDGEGQTLEIFRQGAGLLVREPDAGPSVNSENWLKLWVGYTSPTGRGAAWAATNQGSTTSLPDDYLYGTFDTVALCRLGTLFSSFAYVGPSWVPVPAIGLEKSQHLALTDAELIQVGVVAHAAPNEPGEVVARARYVDFIPVTTTCVDALPDPTIRN